MDHSLFSVAPLDTDKFDISINVFLLIWLCFNRRVSIIVLTDICRSFLRVSEVTEKIKTRSKPTPSEHFNSHPL
jgi:hypothetical protein